MHPDLINFANVVMKLSMVSELTLKRDKNSVKLCVDGETIYHLPSSNTVVRRSVRGPVIRVPSLYRCDYFYNHDSYWGR